MPSRAWDAETAHGQVGMAAIADREDFPGNLVQEHLHRLGWDTPDIAMLGIPDWPSTAKVLALQLIDRLDAAEDRIREIGGTPPS